MSGHATTVQLLKLLGAHAEVIALAYATPRSILDAGKVPANTIDELVRHRLASYDSEDSRPRLSPKLVKLLEAALQSERLRQVDLSVAESMGQLRELTQSYLKSRHTSLDDAQQFLDSIHEVADTLCDDLNEVARNLWQKIRSEFSIVTSLEAKRALNQADLARTRRLLDALREIDLAELNEMGMADRSLRKLFGARLPQVMEKSRQNLADALAQLTEMLFKFQRMEARTGLVKGFIRQYQKYPDYQPQTYEEQVVVPELCKAVPPMLLAGHADIKADSQPLQFAMIELLDGLREDILIAEPKTLSDGSIELDADEPEVVTHDPLSQKIRGIFVGVLQSREPVSGMAIFHDSGCPDPELWLLSILAEHALLPDSDKGFFEMRFVGEPDPFFTGNLKATDIMVCPR